MGGATSGGRTASPGRRTAKVGEKVVPSVTASTRQRVWYYPPWIGPKGSAWGLRSPRAVRDPFLVTRPPVPTRPPPGEPSPKRRKVAGSGESKAAVDGEGGIIFDAGDAAPAAAAARAAPVVRLPEQLVFGVISDAAQSSVRTTKPGAQAPRPSQLGRGPAAATSSSASCALPTPVAVVAPQNPFHKGSGPARGEPQKSGGLAPQKSLSIPKSPDRPRSLAALFSPFRTAGVATASSAAGPYVIPSSEQLGEAATSSRPPPRTSGVQAVFGTGARDYSHAPREPRGQVRQATVAQKKLFENVVPYVKSFLDEPTRPVGQEAGPYSFGEESFRNRYYLGPYQELPLTWGVVISVTHKDKFTEFVLDQPPSVLRTEDHGEYDTIDLDPQLGTPVSRALQKKRAQELQRILQRQQSSPSVTAPSESSGASPLVSQFARPTAATRGGPAQSPLRSPGLGQFGGPRADPLLEKCGSSQHRQPFAKPQQQDVDPSHLGSMPPPLPGGPLRSSGAARLRNSLGAAESPGRALETVLPGKRADGSAVIKGGFARAAVTRAFPSLSPTSRKKPAEAPPFWQRSRGRLEKCIFFHGQNGKDEACEREAHFHIRLGHFVKVWGRRQFNPRKQYWKQSFKEADFESEVFAQRVMVDFLPSAELILETCRVFSG